MTTTAKVITVRDMIRSVAERWKRQYHDTRGGQWMETTRGDSRLVYERLLTLDTETATPEDVAAIVGNDSWTRGWCGLCQQYVGTVVRFERDDYELPDACADCVHAAVAALAATEAR